MSEKYAICIGRWCPLHKGHKELIRVTYEKKGVPVLVMVRDTDEQPPTLQRVSIITQWMKEEQIPGYVMVIPDIIGVYYGRGVGYEVEQIISDEDAQQVSGTQVRRNLAENTVRDVYYDVVESVSVKVDSYLYKYVKKKIEGTVFNSVDEYVAQMLKNEFPDAEIADEQTIWDRLRKLGYVE